ncbi:unnamed protein product, partial [Musa hybrid cultivar]
MNPTVPVANKILDRIPQAYNIQKARLRRIIYLRLPRRNRSSRSRSVLHKGIEISQLVFDSFSLVLLLNLVTSNIGSRRSDRRKREKVVAECVEEKIMVSVFFTLSKILHVSNIV